MAHQLLFNFFVPKTKRKGIMSQRESNLIWLKDMLENLSACRQQLEWADDQRAIQVLTETMLRDLDCCRQLCESMHRRHAQVA
jgi:hypothetical protein